MTLIIILLIQDIIIFYFPGGFLNELKRDLHAAYKHYSQAYNLLMEVRATDTNIMEVKTVGGFINYKMCKLAFALNLPRDAISQFRRHMDIFQLKVATMIQNQ